MPRPFFARAVPTALLLALAPVAVAPAALAQPAASPPPPPPTAAPPVAAPKADAPLVTTAPAAKDTGEVAPPSDATKAEARGHFEKGLRLLQEEAWAAALAEFLISRELFPTRAATTNAAVALRKLQRYDESLDMFEALLRDFANVPAGERATAQRAIAELRERVGTIDITGAEPGASIVIGGQARGEYPPVTPLRVSAGTHLVRIIKEGFDPFEARADVAGGQTARVSAKMHALTASGRLKVSERGGRTLDVLVDNVVVGQTPWEGALAVGSHTVLLHGKGTLGTQPAAAEIKSQSITALALVADELESALHVQPTPAGASVAIDSVPVGHGVWIGRLKAGPHQVEISAEGFLSTSRKINIVRGGREIVTAELERDPNAAVWKKPSKIVFDAGVGFVLAPTLGGDIAGCTGGCSHPIGIGAIGLFHGGYQLGSGIGFGVAAGYLLATQDISTRTTELIPHAKNGLPAPEPGTADDKLRLSAFLGGADVFYRAGDQIPVLFRLGVGAMVGQLRDERSGTFTSGATTVQAKPVVDFPMATSIYIDPEVRVGIRLGEHVDLSAGVQALMLVAIKQPTWNDKLELDAGPGGIGGYKADPLMGQFVLMLAPTASFRYDF
jgi:PEGA domain-containing protein